MNSRDFRCMKHYILNNEKYDVDPALAEKLVTNKSGLLAGGSGDKDVIECPKPGTKAYEVCKDCQFSVTPNSPLDNYGV